LNNRDLSKRFKSLTIVLTEQAGIFRGPGQSAVDHHPRDRKRFVGFIFNPKKGNLMVKSVKKVLWIILFANVLVAVMKIVLGTLIRSGAVMADGFHSLTDGSSNVVGLVGMTLASQPVDKEHPYGHAKFETMSSLVIVGALVMLAFEVSTSAIARFSAPVVPQIGVWTFVVMLTTLVINLVVTTLEGRAGKRLRSSILVADAKHTLSDVFVTIGVILSLGMIKLGFPLWIDPLVSLGVAVMIVKAAIEIFMEASKVLLDAQSIDPSVIASHLKDLPEVKAVHKVRARGTATQQFIDLHVLADPNMTLTQAHELAHRIETAIQKGMPESKVQVITHLEPNTEEEAAEAVSIA
jgi:cation diffusion facilitator family transporter